MGRVEKSVFISYRRADVPWALAIFQELTSHGYDVFFDYLSIPSGDFERIILENIKGRAHFIVILTPSALDACNEPGDWLRREIICAMDEKRNIVPIMVEGFDFESPDTKAALTDQLATLKKYNGLPIPSAYFFEGMGRLRQQFLNVALDAVGHPIPHEAAQIAEAQRVAANEAPRVETAELASQEKLHSLLYRVPVLGRIAAGEPIRVPSTDFNYFDPAEAIEIERSLLPKHERVRNLYALEVLGNSMNDAMINDGDIVVLRATQVAKNGDMVALWLPETYESTLKYYYKEKGGVRLQSANPTLKPILLKSDTPLEIRGRVVMVIRKVGAGT